jgi:hypothetical protein
MESLYSFVDVAGDWKNKIQLLEHVIIEIAEKTEECAKFIEEYASRGLTGTLLLMVWSKKRPHLIIGEGRVMHQTISDTDAKISSLSGELQSLQDKLNRAVTSHIAVVSNETRDNTHRLRKKK